MLSNIVIDIYFEMLYMLAFYACIIEEKFNIEYQNYQII